MFTSQRASLGLSESKEAVVWCTNCTACPGRTYPSLTTTTAAHRLSAVRPNFALRGKSIEPRQAQPPSQRWSAAHVFDTGNRIIKSRWAEEGGGVAMDQVCLCKLGERKHTELTKPQRRSAWSFISVSQQFTSHRASLARKADGAASEAEQEPWKTSRWGLPDRSKGSSDDSQTS